MGTVLKQEMDSIQRKFREICEQLNIKKACYDEAFSFFSHIKNNFTLEGEKLHWLACALYSTLHQKSIKSTGNKNANEKKCSLTNLLKLFNLSLQNFFNSMKKWADVANLSQDLRNKIDNFERNFIITTIIFKKYRSIFFKVFNNLNPTKSMQLRNKKQKIRSVLTINEVFNFCWTLYIYVKFNCSDIEADLVNSYHLLIACVDFCFNNVLFSENSKNLLNPNFSELPNNYLNKNFTFNKNKICIVSALCEEFHGIEVDAKGIKEYWWKPHIKRLAERKILKYKNLENLIGFLDISNFDFNSQSITNEYETCALNLCTIDERIFLHDDNQNDLKNTNVDLLTIQLNQIKKNIEEKKTLAPTTPLSNFHLLNNRDYGAMTPISNATQTVNRLQSILIGYKNRPSLYLKNIFEKSTENLCSSIEERVEKLSQSFLTAYKKTQNEDNLSRPKSPIQSNDFAKSRLNFAVTLYYKMLENIAKREEKMIRANNMEALTCVLSNEMFHIALFACSIEIILFAYKSQRVFPWIIDTFKNFSNLNFQPIDFYKVIELVIRDEEGFSRDIVKHLTSLEERILESLVWKSSSKIWSKIKTFSTIPTFQEVSVISPSKPSSCISKLTKDTSKFDSPVFANIKRKLFDISLDTDSSISKQRNSSQNQILQSDLQNIETYNEKKTNSSNQSVTSINKSKYVDDISQNVVRQKQPHGPLGLFFRKVYYLAWLRLKDLCDRLKKTDEDILQKIWTCFESVVCFNIEMLKDRHLDQIIMCTIYSICKITKRDVTFHEIMESYRHQPQSESHVYRSIFLTKKNNSKNIPQENLFDTTPPTLKELKDNYPIDNSEERGDIIIFYNQIFVTEMKKYIMKFSVDNDSPPLSPLPKRSSNLVSPFKKISLSHPVFVSPLKSSDLVSSPKKHNMYSFSLSPANDLKAFNHLVKSGSSQPNSSLRNSFSGILNMNPNSNKGRKVSKRMFQDDDSNDTSPIKKQCSDLSLLSSKIQSVFSNRDVSNDSFSGDSNLS